MTEEEMVCGICGRRSSDWREKDVALWFRTLEGIPVCHICQIEDLPPPGWKERQEAKGR